MMRKRSTDAKENQMLTNPIFFSTGVNLWSKNSRPMMSPRTPPAALRPRALHSHWTFMKNMVNEAADIPNDCMRTEKSRAVTGDILKARVITGKATAPPPSLVIPKQ